MNSTILRLYNTAKAIAWTAMFSSLFIFTQSYALSLQNIEVKSHLGEPLDAIVRVNAAPGEALSASCLSVSAPTDAAMPAIRGVKLSLSRSVSPGTIRLTTSRPIREPMSELVLRVKCSGTPHVERSFLVMVDPIGTAQTNDLAAQPSYLSASSNSADVASVAPTFSSNNPRIQVAASTSSSYSNNTSDQPSVRPGTSYLVVNGDSLSAIAARIEGRADGSLWSWAATIQSANPHAFINANPNELIAGSSLFVPSKLAPGTNALAIRQGSTTSRQANTPQVERADPVAQVQEAPSAITAKPVAKNTGSVASIKPTMVMSSTFSSISRARLDQRKAGLIHQVPTNLPAFGQAANQSPTVPTEEPEPNPVVPTEQNTVAVVASTNNNRRFPWWGWLSILALLGLSFLGGLLFSSLRARTSVEDKVKARLADARYHERVVSGRLTRTKEVLSGGAASGIVVTETPQEEIVESKTDQRQAAPEITQNDPNQADPLDSNEVEPLEEELDLDIGLQHNLTTVDLELLEQDYAQRPEHGLEQIASAGQGTQFTEIMKSKLDMEFPEEVKMRREADSFDSVEFEGNSEHLDFDIGEKGDNESLEDLNIDMAEAGANIDAQLKAMEEEDNLDENQLDLDQSATLQDSDEQFTATSTRDAEEFYHLEASSIMNVGELSFEQDPDDETNILKFRKRNMKTGTDDGTGEEN